MASAASDVHLAFPAGLGRAGVFCDDSSAMGSHIAFLQTALHLNSFSRNAPFPKLSNSLPLAV